MAMKTRTSNSVRPVYDDFEPSTEFSENPQAQFLRILLPGFKRDEMRITFMNFTRTLNISGERQIDSENDRWVRFNQSYPVPQNCEEGKLQANFYQGVLTITMPKKILSQHSPKTEAQQKDPFLSKKQDPRPDRKAQEEVAQKAPEIPTVPRSEEPKPEKAQEKIPQKYLPNQVEEPRPKKAQERGPNSDKPHEHITQGYKFEELKPVEADEEEIPFKFRIRRGKEDLTQKLEDDESGFKNARGHHEPTKESMPEKGQQEEIEPTPTIVEPQRKPIDEADQRPTLKVARQKPKDEKSEKAAKEIEKERESKKGKLPVKPEKMFQEKEIRTRKRTAETAEKGKETFFTKEDIVSTIGKGIGQVAASASEVVTKISEGKWKEEEKPMLVNMGAAILVIAALGVYVSYKITSSGST